MSGAATAHRTLRAAGGPSPGTSRPSVRRSAPPTQRRCPGSSLRAAAWAPGPPGSCPWTTEPAGRSRVCPRLQVDQPQRQAPQSGFVRGPGKADPARGGRAGSDDHGLEPADTGIGGSGHLGAPSLGRRRHTGTTRLPAPPSARREGHQVPARRAEGPSARGAPLRRGWHLGAMVAAGTGPAEQSGALASTR